MKRALTILPLRLTPHSDRTSILAAYSRELGSVAFTIAAGSKRRALFMPLNPIEVQTTVRPGRELLTLSEPRALMPLHTIISSPERTALAMFMAEVIAPIVRQGGPDPTLFDYIYNAIVRLNNPDTPTANFHLCFLTRMAVILGIAPDISSYRPGKVFDMLDAQFRDSAPLHGHYLSPAESSAVARICRITWENHGQFKFSGQQRAEVLNRILQFYTLHHANISTLKSPAILHAILH